MSWAIWIRGPSSGGERALARAAAEDVRARGERVRVLDGDEVRQTLAPSLPAGDVGRDLLCRTLAYLAVVLAEARMPVIIDAAAPRGAWRDLVRAAIPRFAEVEVAREPAPLPAASLELPRPCEPALLPDLVVDASRETLAGAAARIAALARELGAGPPLSPAGQAGWAIWITGRPGSGKTALAARVEESLAARGVPARVLDLAAARRFLAPDGPASPMQEEIAHRALACAAKLLTEAGVAVIVDATASRRAWREAARALIPCFAEVQLVCPPAVCAERERAVRWRLGGEPRGGGVTAPAACPEIALDYEESIRPDLVLRTHVQDLWSTAEQVLFLAHRLRRMSRLRLEQP